MGENDDKWKDYDNITNGIRQLTEIRFKLLALIPPISGFAISAISFNQTEFQGFPLPRFLVGLLGFVVTLGITFYDQRNSQIYNALIHRAKILEREIGASQFTSRPPRAMFFLNLFLMWHDQGLALIYASVLGGWLFIILCGLLWGLNKMLATPITHVPVWAAIASVIGAAVLVIEFQRLDRAASKFAKTDDVKNDNSVPPSPVSE